MSLYSNISHDQHSAEEFVKEVPIFSGLKPDQIADVASRLSFRVFAPGVTIFHQDMPGTMLYLIEYGSVRIFSIGKTGQELTISIIGRGELFGELAMLDRKPHSASVVTLVETEVWMLALRDFDDLLEKYPQLLREINLMLVNRIRDTTHLVEAMTFEDILGRLAYQLLRLMEKHGQPQEDGVFITIPLTQSELATLVGATREHVNKCLAIMRAQNLISTEEARITLVNPSGLKRIIYERGR